LNKKIDVNDKFIPFFFSRKIMLDSFNFSVIYLSYQIFYPAIV